MFIFTFWMLRFGSFYIYVNSKVANSNVLSLQQGCFSSLFVMFYIFSIYIYISKIDKQLNKYFTDIFKIGILKIFVWSLNCRVIRDEMGKSNH